MRQIFIFLGIVVILVSVFAAVPQAKAMTADEIQSMIIKLQAQIAQLRQQLTAVQEIAPAAWCHDFNADLRYGDQGSEVEALMAALEKEGFSVPDKKSLFDEAVASSVTGFQKKYASEILTPIGLKYGTGFAGPATRAKLNKLYGCAQAVSLSPQVVPSIPSTPSVAIAASVTQSSFFRNDPTAQSIIDGNNFQLRKKGYVIPDTQSFNFKIINVFRQLGYQPSGIVTTDDSLETPYLHLFQKSHNLPITDFIDKNTLLLIDSELFQRENLDKALAEQYPPFVKFIAAPANEPSKEHLAALYSAFFAAMPKNTPDPTWTIDEFRNSLIVGLGANLGKMMNPDGTRILSLDEAVGVMNQKGDFKFCGSVYYWGLNDSTCDKIKPAFEWSSSDYAYMALLLAHEYGHQIGKQNVVFGGQTVRADEQFGKISFYKLNEEWSWVRVGGDNGEFISEYARSSFIRNRPAFPDYEDFAESFTAYVFQGNIFRERAKSNAYLQEKYDFLKKYIFYGAEYDTGNVGSLKTWESNNPGAIPFHPSSYLSEDPAFIWDYKYPFAQVALGKPSPCGIYGDVNGDGYVTNDDINLVNRYVVGAVSLTNDQKIRADVNNDGAINSADFLLISKYVTGAINTFGICATLKASPCSSYGDIDGDSYVTAADAAIISKFNAGSVSLTAVQKTRADVNNDGLINSADSLIIQKYTLGTVSTFAACSAR